MRGDQHENDAHVCIIYVLQQVYHTRTEFLGVMVILLLILVFSPLARGWLLNI